MAELNRISVGEFNISQSMTISEIENRVKNGNLQGIITLEEYFKDYSKIQIEDMEKFEKYINGVNIQIKDICVSNICRVYYNGKFTGIGIIKNGYLKRDIVL